MPPAGDVELHRKLQCYQRPAKFMAFLWELDVRTVPTEMVFVIYGNNGAIEWRGTSLSTVFTQMETPFKPRIWRIIFDIVRFRQCP